MFTPSACRFFLVAWLIWWCSPALAADPSAVNPRQTWQLLDYLAVDYAGAVQGGRVASATEYAEMQEFAATVRTQLFGLPATAQSQMLRDQADRLVAAVAAKADAGQVADLAHHLANDLLATYPIAAVPKTAPDPARAAPLYATQCAACHGLAGKGDGPAAAALKPPPIAFADSERAAHRSPLALYTAISQGIDGTAMTAFTGLSEDERWALAFYVGGFASSPTARAEGEAIWKEHAELRGRIPSLEALTRLSEREFAKSLGDAHQAKAILAFLHAQPQAVSTSTSSVTGTPLALARQRLADSLRAYDAGDTAQAQAAALSSYLDGVEPIEPTLATRDARLLQEIETTMGAFRAQLGRGAPRADLTAQAERVSAVFDRVETVLQDTHTDATTAFLGSFTILLREGLEALLIVIGMIAFLRKAERRDVLRYVHAGWISALLAGGITWAVATYFVSVSGANREVTEGVSALFAAVVLLSVGIWMHQKSLAGRWQTYLKAKVSAALTRRSAVFLFMLAFIAVYREVFETILFFIAMWSEHNGGAIVAGLLAGSAALAGVAYWMLRVSKRLPIAQFFSISSLLIAVLAVVLVGKGVAALQEAGWVAQALVAVPRIEWLGVYPSWQSLTAQMVVAVVAVAGFYLNMRSSRTLAPVTMRSGP